jgi:dihydropteroate synthase
MGIINLTPDSFYDGGRYQQKDLVLGRVEKLLGDGADIIDIGATSSKPGATDVSVIEEKKRLYETLDLVRKTFPELIISVDTFRAEIAKEVVQNFEVDMINDISAGQLDEKMFETIAALQVPYIMMHIKGTPSNMQENPVYENLMHEIILYFSEKISQLNALGVADILIDPGFGFGKTLEYNYELLAKLHEFKIFEKPLLVGLSRKSMIYKLLHNSPDQALNGTSVLNTFALMNGANILRVHDVKEAKEVILLVEKVKESLFGGY